MAAAPCADAAWAAPDLSKRENVDYAYALVIVRVLPAGVVGLMLVSVLA